ncbi:S-layer homology domain-containing protein, partial [Paenibacillus sepulcri]|nr:S-layer homology domain-containing protein [Paenibacillus sepulcri]
QGSHHPCGGFRAAVNPAQPGTYNDSGKISAWAQEAVNEATGLGIIQGDEDGAFKPDALSTRAETALMLYRMLDKLSFI